MQMGRTGFIDLEKHFAFYGAYHSNPVNILIHTLFVWPIFFTSLILFYFTPSIYDLPPIGFIPSALNHALVLNFGFVFALMYALFYVLLDKKAGSLAALICMVCWVGASYIAVRLGYSLAWKVVLAAQLICWTGQFLGHGVFESTGSFGQSCSSFPNGSFLCVAGGASNCVWIRAISRVSCNCESEDRY
ncbi:uncharacterized endoplasmic reticulum membrane protein C16E8.02 isoform X2 [Carica papaya]|uniref:uncharacterized endoplasmic reticulum membrane protein C16E8.02 isoform X2 n=1 Tax=Carica papaya TaxID=3649 RepID=UPI000B8CB80B|nr:uncharacterized endoplasmic reticulum membrane protein C16E8.02 isoform X2 [Carica papaya]